MRITDNGVTLAGSSVAVPVDIQGINMINPSETMPVSGSGISGGTTESDTSAVDIITLVTGDQLRNTTAKTIALPSLLKYKRYVIQVYNGMDQDVKVVPWNTAPALLEDDTIGFFATASTEDLAYSWTIPKKDTSNSGIFFLNEMIPKSNGVGTKKVKSPDKLFETKYNVDGSFLLAYRAPIAPTASSLTIRFIGFKR